jgi:hypothetical protein
MFKRLVISLAILAGLLALADRGLAAAAGNATGDQIRIHEGLKEDADVTFRGFPFLTQAIHGRFRHVDVTVRDLQRGGVTFDRIDARLEGVEVDLREALKGRVNAVPVREGDATIRLTYGDLGTWLATRPGNIRLVVRDGKPYVVSSFGIPGVGSVDVEGTPTVRTTAEAVRIVVSDVRVVTGTRTLTATLATSAAARASFTIPLKGLPFGIQVKSATLTADAVVVEASATGLVIDVRDNVR